MEEMIAHCAKFTAEFNKSSNTHFTEEEAIAQMRAFFPHSGNYSAMPYGTYSQRWQ